MGNSIKEQELQYLVDEAGIRTAVILPIEEWEHILAWYRQTQAYQDLKEGLKSAFQEVREIEKGNAPKRTLDELFEELAHED